MESKVCVAVAVLLLLSAACQRAQPSTSEPAAATEKSPQAPAPAATPKAGALLARLPDREEGASAATKGTLRIEDGCVVLEQDDGTTLLLGVTHPGITWSDDTQQLAQNGATFTPGARVGVGGMKASKTIADTLAWRTPLPSACAAHPVWITSSIGAE
jgi:hypothetical protein